MSKSGRHSSKPLLHRNTSKLTFHIHFLSSLKHLISSQMRTAGLCLCAANMISAGPYIRIPELGLEQEQEQEPQNRRPPNRTADLGIENIGQGPDHDGFSNLCGILLATLQDKGIGEKA